jgi:hypothetical protein
MLDDALLSRPITGIACRARAASGHAAVLPRTVMNSRRFIIGMAANLPQSEQLA